MSNIFRKKTMDRVSSPEQLNDYIRVTSPSLWLVLLGLLILLVGVIAWSIFGTVPEHGKDGTVSQIHPIKYVIN